MVFNVSKQLLATASRWFADFFKESKNETQINSDFESIDIQNWLSTFHNRAKEHKDIGTERIGQFLMVCIKYITNEPFREGCSVVKKMETFDNDLILKIVQNKNLQFLFPYVLKNIIAYQMILLI